MNFKEARNLKDYSSVNFNGKRLMITPKGTGSFSLDNIDLTGISAAELTVGWQAPPQFGYTFELHLDAPDGKKIGEAVLEGTGEAKANQTRGGTQLKLDLEPVTDGKLHNLYIVSKPNNEQEPRTVALQEIQFNTK